MDLDHETLVAFARTAGLLYLLALFLGAAVYAYWPSRRDAFDRAARSLLDDEDGPCR
jgi:cytochrome c oxidase cbb3-type subunit 4